jgi:hypothetical protein
MGGAETKLDGKTAGLANTRYTNRKPRPYEAGRATKANSAERSGRRR